MAKDAEFKLRQDKGSDMNSNSVLPGGPGGFKHLYNITCSVTGCDNMKSTDKYLLLKFEILWIAEVPWPVPSEAWSIYR